MFNNYHQHLSQTLKMLYTPFVPDFSRRNLNLNSVFHFLVSLCPCPFTWNCPAKTGVLYTQPSQAHQAVAPWIHYSWVWKSSHFNLGVLQLVSDSGLLWFKKKKKMDSTVTSWTKISLSITPPSLNLTRTSTYRAEQEIFALVASLLRYLHQHFPLEL